MFCSLRRLVHEMRSMLGFTIDFTGINTIGRLRIASRTSAGEVQVWCMRSCRRLCVGEDYGEVMRCVAIARDFYIIASDVKTVTICVCNVWSREYTGVLPKNEVGVTPVRVSYNGNVSVMYEEMGSARMYFVGTRAGRLQRG